MKILIADDDASTRAALKVILESAGYECCWARDGKHALDLFQSACPDMVVLDVMMPVLNGFEVCEEIRKEAPDIPVLFLSAKGEIEDRKCGLRIGADDYMAKPFDAEELLLRLNALTRRARATDSSNAVDTIPTAIKIGPIAVNLQKHRVTVHQKQIALTPNEFQIISLLAQHAGEVVTQKELIEAVWGDNFTGETTSVAVYIRHIREKIETSPSKPQFLQTVWGIGYRLSDEDS